MHWACFQHSLNKFKLYFILASAAGLEPQMQLWQSRKHARGYKRRSLMTFFVVLKGLLSQVWRHSISRFWKVSLFAMQLMHLWNKILMQPCVSYPSKSAVWGTWSISDCSPGRLGWVYLYSLLLNIWISTSPQRKSFMLWLSLSSTVAFYCFQHLSFWAQFKQNHNPHISITGSFLHLELIYSNNVMIFCTSGWISNQFYNLFFWPSFSKYSWILLLFYFHFDSANIHLSQAFSTIWPWVQKQRKKESKAGRIKM